MTNLTADTVGELFGQAVLLAAAKGEKVSPRGMLTREVLDVTICLARPRARLLAASPARIINPAFAVAETVWILSGSDARWIFGYNSRIRQYADGGILQGAYGPRMRKWAGGVDQLRRVVEILQADPDSRRAVIQLYDPSRDAAGHKDVPCTLGFRFYLRRGRLHMSTSMRSQDVWTGIPYDLFFFTTLHELIAGWLDAEPGNHRHHVGSLHIYERDLDQAGEVTGIPASQVMPELAAPWAGFDELLGRVEAGEEAGHPGWDAMSATMRSYRLWKSGDRDEARRVAVALPAPLRESVIAWYAELTRRAAAAPSGPALAGMP